MNKENQFSFQNGWQRIKQAEVAEVRAKIMKALNLTTRVGFLDRLNGKYEPSITAHQEIERIFIEHGINKAQIWGDYVPDRRRRRRSTK